MVNYFFDSSFSEDNLKSLYTRGSYAYGGPLAHGSPPYTSSSDRYDDQETAYVQWFWRDAQLQQTYDEHDSSRWRAVRLGSGR